MMLYVHKNNLENKISTNYKGKKEEIFSFMEKYYVPLRKSIDELVFDEEHKASFESAATYFNEYYGEIESFAKKHNIKSQSKFGSTFLEEISSYLFKDLPSIKDGSLSVFNKGIYAGIKIVNENDISIIKKDVDFCIGKKVNISIDNSYQENIILPVIAVEVKTYLDATMFGEIKSSSRAIKSATPGSKTYVLMGYKDLADDHIIAARQDAALTEMFALRESKNARIDASALYEYWKEISNAVSEVGKDDSVQSLGKILYPDKI